jgi:hypothetical protein
MDTDYVQKMVFWVEFSAPIFRVSEFVQVDAEVFGKRLYVQHVNRATASP